MNNKYKTISGLFQELNRDILVVTTYRGKNFTNPERVETPLYSSKMYKYLSGFPAGTLITPDFYVKMVDEFFPKGNFWSSDVNEDDMEDLWRIGYYSGVWATNFDVACIVAFLNTGEFVDESAEPFIEAIKRRIDYFYKNPLNSVEGTK